MALVVVRHKVKDYATWKKAFDAHLSAQQGAGLSHPRVFRSADDRNEVVILLDASNIAEAKKFASSSDLKIDDAIRRRGRSADHLFSRRSTLITAVRG